MIARIKEAFAWRWRAFSLWWFGRLARLGARIHIHTRWPWPVSKPWRRSRLSIYPIEGGVGDELMCAPILAEIKRRNPSCEITFHCRHPELFAGNPHVHRLEKMAPDAHPPGHGLIYRNAVRPPRPVMAMMAECVGLILEDPRFSPAPTNGASEETRRAMDSIDGPVVVVQPLASQWTPNKQWPLDEWRELIGELAADVDVVEIGGESVFEEPPDGRFHDLTGRTTLMDLAYVVSRADVFVGLPSSGMHFAGAFDVPMVMVFSGYESPDTHFYRFAEVFHDPPHCAPCWLRTPCPYDLKCLREIRPAEVASAVRRVLAGGEGGSSASAN